MIVTGPAGYDLLGYARNKLAQLPQVSLIEILEHKKKTGTATGIFVEDIRELQQTVKTRQSQHKTIVLLSDAAKMTNSAQVSMLKLLEEPRTDLYLILLTSSPSSLLDTIISRCRLVKLPAEAVSGYDPQVTFMSRGINDEAKRLATDNSYRQKRQQQYQLAKQFIAADSYSKLQIIISIQKLPRQEVIGFIDAAIHISSAVLKSNPSARIIHQTEVLLDVAEALGQNGNVRAQLLRTVL